MSDAHIEATVAAITELHDEHYRKADRTQRLVASTTSFFARPRSLVWLTVAIGGWIAFNLVLLVSGRHVLDAPPFPYLADAASILALYLTTMILITQRHDDDLATRRSQLTLELAVLQDQRSARILQLLDAQQGVAADPADPHELVDRLQRAHGDRDERDAAPRADD